MFQMVRQYRSYRIQGDLSKPLQSRFAVSFDFIPHVSEFRSPLHSRSLLSLWPALALTLLTLTACSDDVVSVLDAERTFTLYGYLDPSADTQAVRIFAVDSLLSPWNDAPLDVLVRSIDLKTGEEHQWRDSLVRYADGTIGHVYWSAFRPSYEGAYRLEIRAPDGTITSARAEVPGPVAPEVGETMRMNPTDWPADMRIPVTWTGGPGELVRTNLHYRVAYAHFVHPGCYELRDTTVVIENAVTPTRLANGWATEVRLTQDVPRLGDKLFREQILGSPSGGFVLLTLAMEVFVGDPAWIPPGGRFDLETLSDPRLFTNVTNGFGFLGAGYAHRIDLPYDLEAPALAGFTPPKEYFSEENDCRGD